MTWTEFSQALNLPLPLLLALGLGVALLAGTVLVVLAITLARGRRTQSLMQFFQRHRLTAVPTDAGTQQPWWQELADFELPRNARWFVTSLWRGPLPAHAGGELSLAQLRGDPFNLPHATARDAELTVTVLRLRVPGLSLPKFILVPRNLVTKRMKAHEDTLMDFGDQFTHTQALLGPDGATLRRLFNLRAREALRSNRRYTLEGVGDSLLIYQFPQPLDGLQAQDALNYALALLRTLEPTPTPAPAER